MAHSESAPGRPSPLLNAARFWEKGRIGYNAALIVVVVYWIAATWPHFLPAFNWYDLGRLIILGLIMNVCYSSAYLIDLSVQATSVHVWWLRNRWILWLVGTLFAILLAWYWIGDEIYPSVTAVGR